EKKMSWKQIWAAAGAAALAMAMGAAPAAAQPGARHAPPRAASTPASAQTASSAPASVQDAAPNGESVAAVVNDEVISTYDVRQRAQLLLLQSQFQPTPEIMQQASAQALRDLIDEHLQLQETGGEPYKIHITDAEVDRRLGDIAHSNNTTV